MGAQDARGPLQMKQGHPQPAVQLGFDCLRRWRSLDHRSQRPATRTAKTPPIFIGSDKSFRRFGLCSLPGTCCALNQAFRTLFKGEKQSTARASSLSGEVLGVRAAKGPNVSCLPRPRGGFGWRPPDPWPPRFSEAGGLGSPEAAVGGPGPAPAG